MPAPGAGHVSGGLRKLNEAAYVSEDPIVHAGRSEIDVLKEAAPSAPLGRSRILAHGDTSEVLHEMLIAHAPGSYVPPHKHPGKSESGHVVEGEIDLVFFDEQGEITHVLELGEYSSGRDFYYRIDEPLYHTLILRTPGAVVHEVTNGPFVPEETLYAPWAPTEDDSSGRRAFQQRLVERVAALR